MIELVNRAVRGNRKVQAACMSRLPRTKATPSCFGVGLPTSIGAAGDGRHEGEVGCHGTTLANTLVCWTQWATSSKGTSCSLGFWTTGSGSRDRAAHSPST